MNETTAAKEAEMPAETPREPSEGWAPFILDVVKFSVISLLIVIPFRIFIAQPYIVNGSSMEDAFHSGEYLIVDQLSYRFKEPNRGDVVVFRFPQAPALFFIKRIIGLPNETISIDRGTITIKNTEHPEGFALPEPYLTRPFIDDMKPVTLKNDEYFVMGDNRQASLDSRAWGPLSRTYLSGEAFVRLLPPIAAALYPGHMEDAR